MRLFITLITECTTVCQIRVVVVAVVVCRREKQGGGGSHFPTRFAFLSSCLKPQNKLDETLSAIIKVEKSVHFYSAGLAQLTRCLYGQTYRLLFFFLSLLHVLPYIPPLTVTPFR